MSIADLNFKYLSDDDMDNPERVFTSFFDCYHLHEAREMFCLLRNGNNDDDIEYFFERLEKLIEAAYFSGKRLNIYRSAGANLTL